MDASSEASEAENVGALERLVPETGPPDLVAEHVARYEFARQFVGGRLVLDCACGSGYGSVMLADDAAGVYGLDLKDEALAESSRRRPGVSSWLVQGTVLSLPFASRAFDVVVSFETIEHVSDGAQAVGEMRRVLKDDGLLVISAPNRAIYRDERHIENPYHVKEPDLAEFEAMLGAHFPTFQILGERWNQGVLIGSSGVAALLSGPNGASTPDLGQSTLERADYLVAVCGFGPLPSFRSVLYVPDTGNVMLERTRWAQTLDQEVQDLRRQRAELLEVAEGLRGELVVDRSHYQELSAQHQDLMARHFLVPTPRAVLSAVRRRIARLSRRVD